MRKLLFLISLVGLASFASCDMGESQELSTALVDTTWEGRRIETPGSNNPTFRIYWLPFGKQ